MLTKPDSEKKLSAATSLEDLVLADTAYIKTITVKGQRAYAIHSAEGKPLAVASEREIAFATARQNDLNPISVH